MALEPFRVKDYVEEEAVEVQCCGNEYQICLTTYCKQDNEDEKDATDEEGIVDEDTVYSSTR